MRGVILMAVDYLVCMAGSLVSMHTGEPRPPWGDHRGHLSVRGCVQPRGDAGHLFPATLPGEHGRHCGQRPARQVVGRVIQWNVCVDNDEPDPREPARPAEFHSLLNEGYTLTKTII